VCVFVSEASVTAVVVWVHGATRLPRAAGELSVSQCTRYIHASVHRVLLAADQLPEYDDRL